MIDVIGSRTIARTAVVVTLLGIPVSSAQAQERPPRPDDVSAISVYTELMPTSAGPRVVPRAGMPPTRVETAAAGAAPLSPTIRRELRNVPKAEAKKLEQIATSRTHGAPRPPRGLPAGDRVALSGEEAAAFDTTLDATAQSNRVIALFGVLTAATAAAGILFLRRRD